jgi:hypothetical protein
MEVEKERNDSSMGVVSRVWESHMIVY